MFDCMYHVGMAAGATGALIGTPAEISLIRMTSDGRCILPIHSVVWGGGAPNSAHLAMHYNYETITTITLIVNVIVFILGCCRKLYIGSAFSMDFNFLS